MNDRGGLLRLLMELQDTCGGVIPVDRFMSAALYHPDAGYYTKNIRTVGRRGDFSTSASLGRVLGVAIAGWIRAMRRRGAPRAIIEIGGGTGVLGKIILKELGITGRFATRYHMVESSPVLQREQMATMKGFRVTWHHDMRAALDACGGRAIAFSNELIDAFPCRVFEKRDGRWFEVGLQIEGSQVAEVLMDRSLPPNASVFEVPFPNGQRVEIHVSAGEWMASWSEVAKHVELLTIDYGGSRESIYSRRPGGTLRAYFHQQRCSGSAVFHRFGKQDITADVNFSDLIAWGEHLGWKTIGLRSQGAFIREFVPASEFVDSPADVALADLSGAGEAFHVLHQQIAD